MRYILGFGLAPPFRLYTFPALHAVALHNAYITGGYAVNLSSAAA